MSNEVYANGNAIACKAGSDKVLAAMPDVCLSPPSPPAGPLPLPYPNTSFSKDMKEGSTTVKIGGSEVMLKDQSYYKSSPLGDEAATNSFGGSVVTHVITGKTYFNAWSMDVSFEGANVDRHLDLTTSNHASYPGSTGPMSAMEGDAVMRILDGRCPCCDQPLHNANPNNGAAPAPVAWYADGNDTAMNRDEWYLQNITRRFAPNAQNAALDRYVQLIDDAQTRAGCTCPQPPPPILPAAPCDVFFDNPDPQRRAERRDHIRDSWNGERPNYQANNGILSVPDTIAALQTRPVNPIANPTQPQVDAERKVNHLTPKTAGGCPTGDRNLQPNGELCEVCRGIDARFNEFQ